MASATRKLCLANNFQPTSHRAARSCFGRGGQKVFQPASTADISSFIKRAREAAASEGHHDHRVTSVPLPLPFETTPLEILALALAVFAVVCVLSCMVMIAIKMKHSRAQHESYSFPDSDSMGSGASQDAREAFIGNIKRLSKRVPETEMNRLQDLEENKTSLAPKHIFRPWTEAVIDRKGGNRELGDGSIRPYAFSKDPVRFGRKASRPFCNNGTDATSQNPYSRM
ncbi:hypothetical protein LZ32DRAFT_641547 [Colletotrichum eremochloae]|nr:hypothetical protein LZ32DRAFT_641547 [Colletotrichum eremochloae]